MNKKVKITIGETQFHFWFGLGFFSDLKDNHGIKMEDIQVNLNENPLKLVPLLMLESARYSAKRRKVKENYTEFTFIDALDDDGGISSEAFLEFLSAFTKSMTKDVPKEEVPKKKELAKK